MGTALMANDQDINAQIEDFFKSGKTVEELPEQKKPVPRSVVYPLSGKHVKEKAKYTDGKERSPAMKLLKLSLHGMNAQGGGGKTEISPHDVAGALAGSSPGRARAEYKAMWPNGEPVKVNGKPDIEITIEHEKLSEQAYYFGLAKYLDDKEAIGRCYSFIFSASVDVSKENEWDYRKGVQTLRAASMLAMDRHLDRVSTVYCLTCNGTGNNQKGSCPKCAGTGQKKVSLGEIGKRIDIKGHSTQRVWADRIELLYKIIEGWDKELIRHLQYHFSREV